MTRDWNGTDRSSSKTPFHYLGKGDDSAEVSGNHRGLLTLAAISAAIYGLIAWLSLRFEFDSPTHERPIVTVLFLLAAAFCVYALAIRSATRAQQNSRLVWLIVGAAVVFRVTMLLSVPIQEVDVYRYIWDGVVCSQGVSPFRYPPNQVESALWNSTPDPDLKKLTLLCEQTPAIAEVLRRVHFSELPTVYPLTSQVVFCGAALTTPRGASVATRLRIMKLWLLSFDLGVVGLVIKLLRICDLPVGLSVTYAWCPLVMKEVANSGHLDTIAVFLTIWVIYLVVLAVKATSDEESPSVWHTLRLVLIALVLSAAIGAKLYPVVLAPLVFFVTTKRFGWRCIVLPSVVFAMTTTLVLWPMLPIGFDQASELPADPMPFEYESPFKEVADGAKRLPELPAVARGTEIGTSGIERPPENDPSLGVRTFLKSWEMNDFIFMLIEENLKPAAAFPDNQRVWFSLAPDEARRRMVAAVSNTFSIPVSAAPFMMTRFATAIVFFLLAMWLAFRAGQQRDAVGICRAAFLTLAWFWLLCPTQNPWYWLWALPLLAFVRNRAWFAVSGLVLVYYLRFWFQYHLADAFVLGTNLRGVEFFDFVVTWLEFGPWFLWLMVASVWKRR